MAQETTGKKVAVILSGCGVFDGSEIYETTLTLLHLKKNGVDYECLAPNVDMYHVLNYNDGEPMAEKRNVLTESARLARGPVKKMTDAVVADYDGVIFPGGFGAAKNLSNFAYEENIDNLRVEPTVEAFLGKAYEDDLPLGFICISPASVAAIALKDKGLTLTIGTDEDTAQKIEALGHTHKPTQVDDIVVDDGHNVVSTSAYMMAEDIAQAESGIEKLVKEVVSRIGRQRPAKSA